MRVSRKNILHFQIPFTTSDGRSLMNRMKLFRINAVVCNSFFTKNIIDKNYSLDSKVVYPPVDIAKINPRKKQNYILAVGRFSQLKQAKRQDVLISAFRKLYRNNKSFKLVLAGGVEVGVGGYLNKLKNVAKNLPVEFVESPNNKTLLKLYGSAKLFWSASGYGIDEKKEPERVEHFGISPVEAMAAGCVPFLYSAGGHKEIIEDDQNGFLWNNTNELVKVSQQLIDDKERFKKISENATERCKKFGYREFEKQILSLLR